MFLSVCMRMSLCVCVPATPSIPTSVSVQLSVRRIRGFFIFFLAELLEIPSEWGVLAFVVREKLYIFFRCWSGIKLLNLIFVQNKK